jgi:FHS family L-fucose permease-like MFS transporter
MLKNKSVQIGFVAIVSLFFLWALAHNLNPILIPHLKKACSLNDMQSALVDACFYIAYFVMAIPAGLLIKRFGYQKTIVFGLLLFAFGAFLFYPAASARSYAFFLSALFIIASGLTFLETAANPYVSILGKPETATQRLNFAQSFNGLGAGLAAFLGGKYILSGKVINTESLSGLDAASVEQLLQAEANMVQIPYLIIGSIVFLVALMFMWLPLPQMNVEEQEKKSDILNLLGNKNLRQALLAQFFYVGAQVGIGSFFIRYCLQDQVLQEKTAASYLSIALFLFMSGRFLGSWIMKYIASNKLLAAYSLINIALLLTSIFAGGTMGIYTLMATQFFMSIMFPTIFSNGIKGLGSDMQIASSLMVMTIVGGAICPLAMGAISDASEIRFAFLVPIISFGIIYLFAKNQLKTS